MGKLFNVNNMKSNEENTVEINGRVFNKFKLSDEKWVQPIFELYEINSWELCFYNFIVYNSDNNQFVYLIINRYLCIFRYYSKSKSGQAIDLCFMPFAFDGKNRNIDKIMIECKHILESVNGSDYRPKCILLNEYMISVVGDQICDVSKDSELNDITYNLDYLYSLCGSKLKNKRRDYNRFKRDYPNVYVTEYDPNLHIDSCLEMFNKWKGIFRSRTKESIHGLKTYKYVFESIVNTDSSHCYVLMDGEKVIGYMNAFLLYKDICMCDKRISNEEYYGSSNFLLIEVCKILNEMGYSYMNDGNTGGNTNLRPFKMGYADSEDRETFSYEAYIK